MHVKAASPRQSLPGCDCVPLLTAHPRFSRLAVNMSFLLAPGQLRCLLVPHPLDKAGPQGDAPPAAPSPPLPEDSARCFARWTPAARGTFSPSLHARCPKPHLQCVLPGPALCPLRHSACSGSSRTAWFLASRGLFQAQGEDVYTAGRSLLRVSCRSGVCRPASRSPPAGPAPGLQARSNVTSARTWVSGLTLSGPFQVEMRVLAFSW